MFFSLFFSPEVSANSGGFCDSIIECLFIDCSAKHLFIVSFPLEANALGDSNFTSLFALTINLSSVETGNSNFSNFYALDAKLKSPPC